VQHGGEGAIVHLEVQVGHYDVEVVSKDPSKRLWIRTEASVGRLERDGLVFVRLIDGDLLPLQALSEDFLGLLEVDMLLVPRVELGFQLRYVVVRNDRARL